MTRIRAIAALALFCSSPFRSSRRCRRRKSIYDAIYKIKDEGLNRSQVMDTLSYLSDVYGARLTGSPQIKAAAEWTKKKLTEWGLTNVNLETWGPFGRGWTNEKFTARAISPSGSFPLIAYPKAWTPGTQGPVEGGCHRCHQQRTGLRKIPRPTPRQIRHDCRDARGRRAIPGAGPPLYR